MALNIASKIFLLSVLLCVIFDSVNARSFTIDYENDCFLKDGKTISLYICWDALFSSAADVLEGQITED